MQVEICASTLRDVAVAMEVGADRVELCSVWTAGGLTPSAVLVQSAVAMGMPVRALVRPREGHFVWSNSERTWSVEEPSSCSIAAEAVVVGGLNEEGPWTRPTSRRCAGPWGRSMWFTSRDRRQPRT